MLNHANAGHRPTAEQEEKCPSCVELKANCSISGSHSVCMTQNNREHRAEIKAPVLRFS